MRQSNEKTIHDKFRTEESNRRIDKYAPSSNGEYLFLLFPVLRRFNIEQLLEPFQCTPDTVCWDKNPFSPFTEIDIVRDLNALDLGPALPAVGLDGFFLSISSTAGGYSLGGEYSPTESPS